jgi:hypothetical protein
VLSILSTGGASLSLTLVSGQWVGGGPIRNSGFQPAKVRIWL